LQQTRHDGLHGTHGRTTSFPAGDKVFAEERGEETSATTKPAGKKQQQSAKKRTKKK
jgi:hypothetical protein